MKEIIISLISSVFDIFIILIYFSNMLGKRQKKIHPVFFYGSFVLMEIILNISLYFFADIHTTLRLYISIMISLITSYLLTLFYDAFIRHRLFVVFSFQIYCNISELIIFYIGNFVVFLMGKEHIPNDYIMNFLSKIVTFILIIITILIRNRKKEDYGIQYSLLILLTPVVSIITILSFPYPDTNAANAFIMQIVSASGVMFLNIANYFLLDSLLISRKLKVREAQLMQQIKYQSEKYDMISVAYRDTRRLIHDTKKHYFFINSVAEKIHCSEICDYINKELPELEARHILVNCGNLVIDSFVGYFIQLAEKEGTNFDTHIRISPQLIPMKDNDLCIIIGNLLENALEANRKIKMLSNRNILFEAYTSEDNFTLHISNAIADNTIYQDISSKHDKLNHGFGLQNVNKIVDKYKGIYTHEICDDRYNTIIVIPALNKRGHGY